MSAAEIVHQFADAINRHDVQAITTLMATGHLFTDSLGNRVQGAAAMERGWRGYFTMCPDYWIRIDNAVSDDALVLACGEAGGTIDGAGWKIPAAWRAVIRDGKIAEFQVFADNKPVYEILAKRK